ncbi:MAG: sugar phosphate isomerase/epimerase family protein [Verrucomicrobiales bacterium]
MNRRHLLSLLPAAAGLGLARGIASPIAPTALTKAGFAISVQCWSFRNFSLFEAIEMSAAAGAGVVEIFPGQKVGGPVGDVKMGPDLPDDALKAILDHAASKNIAPANFGVTDIPKDEAGARKFFEMARKLGLYGLTTEAIGSIDTLEKLAKEYGIKVGFHNHPQRPKDPNYKIWDPNWLYEQIKDRDPHIGICADTGHWATSGLDPAAVVNKVADRVVAYHLKDRGSIKEHSNDRPFGTGIIDIPAMLAATKAKGFSGNVSIEYEINWDKSLPEVAQCVGYLRAWSNQNT